MSPAPAATPTALTAVRALWGTTLLLAPRRLLHTAGHPPTRAAVAVLRVLGARHIGQSAVTADAPLRPALRWGAAVDALHAATGLALAAASPRWRRAALLDAAVASGFAVTGLGPRPRHRDTAGAAPRSRR